MKKVFGFFTVLLTATLLFTSCDSGEGDVAELDFHFHPKAGSEDFAFDQTYEINGKATQFTLAQFYVHGIELGYEDGSTTTIDDYLLVKAGHAMYSLGEVPVGKVTSVKFNVGVDATNNSQTEENFTARSSDDPLSIQDPKMHWNWNMGYIFAKVEGTFDDDGDGTPETGFAYHIGRDEMLRSIEISTDKDITADDTEVMIMVNYANFFNNIDLSADAIVHGMSAEFMDNIKSSFVIM